MVAVAAEAGRARRACKLGVDAESTFDTLNATWILQSEGAIWVSQLMSAV